MPEEANKFYVTTPIYYVNARPHIGHAYTTIVADVLARRHRLLGPQAYQDTWFLTGTDEHGQKIERSAAAAGIAPQQFADQISAEFEKLWKRMGITYNQFIRTTDAAHKRGVQKLFSTLYERGRIYLSSYTGQYSIGEEMFVEGPPGTIGPDGKPTETVTEENFFFRLSDYQLPLLDLIESNTLTITPEARKNEVLSFLRGNVGATEPGAPSFPGTIGKGGVSDEVRPASSRHAATALGNPYIPGALKDLSISRSSFTWGIPVPEPAASLTKDPHIIYVWLDALANYMTAVGYGDDSPEGKAKFEKYWPADLHLVGKEIIRFHCVYWPAFLLAADLPLPKAIAAHGWLLFDDAKMSKSKGNIVRTETILEAFGTLCPPPPPEADAPLKGTASAVPPPHPEQAASTAEANSPSPEQRDLFATDVLRYFLLREIPFGQDGSFSFDSLITRYNADLVKGYANTVSRVLSMIQQYSDGVTPPLTDAFDIALHISDLQDSKVWRVAWLGKRGNVPALHTWTSQDGTTSQPPVENELLQDVFHREMKELRLSRAVQLLSDACRSLDSIISAEKPWELAKRPEEADQAKVQAMLAWLTESIRIITALLYPILPYATASVWRQLGLGDIETAAKNGELKDLQWGGLKPGTKLGSLSPIFPRADKGLAQTMSDIEAEKTHQAAQTKLNPPMGTSSAPDSDTPVSKGTSHPGAPPRTGALSEPNPGAQVGGSTATNPERAHTPTHTEAPSSGIFGAPNAQAGAADASPQITIDDFAKVELRVAKVLVCERIPKADKLLRLEVDLGYERRQILTGLAEWYTPEDLIGRRIVVITNLAPRKMRGLESHGMLLAASAPHVDGEKPGKPALATFLDSDDLPLGSRLK